MSKELRVLIVEDSPQDMALINHELRKAGLRFRSRRVETSDSFLHELEHHPPDVILSDHGVPGFDGVAALAVARSRCPEAPFIFVTGAPREEAAQQALQSGADDYVLKSHLHLLAPVVERTLRENSARANRLRLETALLNAEEHLRILIEELKEHATFMLNADGRIATWNPGAETMLGYQPNEILNCEFNDLFAPESSSPGQPDELLDCAEREGRVEQPASFVRKSRETLPADTTLIALRDPSGGLRGFLCVLRDREVRESAQGWQHRAAEFELSARELEKFTHAIALDMQLPLRHIESCSELLAKTAGRQLNPKSQNYLKTISDASRRMSRLVDDLLAFSRVGQAEMYHLSLSLKDIATEVIHELRHETEGRNIDWVVGELPEVMGDSVMLWQVIMNLISNAVKFTRDKEHPRIEIAASESVKEHIIFVRDNGVGFDSQSADRLFAVFQRLHATEFEGTGVGLANVRRIIERHGGRVWADGAAGEGATFYFTLPKAS
jgi:PAS domain S-box-containing protein